MIRPTQADIGRTVEYHPPGRRVTEQGVLVYFNGAFAFVRMFVGPVFNLRLHDSEARPYVKRTARKSCPSGRLQHSWLQCKTRRNDQCLEG
jgi:hypothetical protein